MNETTKEIGGRIINVGFLPALEAVKVEVAIANLCGEALFKAATAPKGDEEAAGAAAISALSSSLDADLLVTTMQSVFKYVTIDGQRITNIDAAFAQRNKDLWQVFFFALKVNFQDFFSAKLFQSLATQVQTASGQ